MTLNRICVLQLPHLYFKIQTCPSTPDSCIQHSAWYLSTGVLISVLKLTQLRQNIWFSIRPNRQTSFDLVLTFFNKQLCPIPQAKLLKMFLDSLYPSGICNSKYTYPDHQHIIYNLPSKHTLSWSSFSSFIVWKLSLHSQIFTAP